MSLWIPGVQDRSCRRRAIIIRGMVAIVVNRGIVLADIMLPARRVRPVGCGRKADVRSRRFALPWDGARLVPPPVRQEGVDVEAAAAAD